MPPAERIAPSYVVGFPISKRYVFIPSDSSARLNASAPVNLQHVPGVNPRLAEWPLPIPGVVQNWLQRSNTSAVTALIVLIAETMVPAPMWLLKASGQVPIYVQSFGGDTITVIVELIISIVDSQQPGYILQNIYDQTITIPGVVVAAGQSIQYLMDFPDLIIEKLLVKGQKIAATVNVTVNVTAGAAAGFVDLNNAPPLTPTLIAGATPLAGINLDFLPAKSFADIALGSKQTS